MKTVALIGAGGKMGLRISENLKDSKDYNLSCVEVSPTGIAALKEMGLKVESSENAVPRADIVILGVPDVAIESVSKEIISQMKEGSLLLTLDPAAPLGGKLAEKDGVSVVIAHPCHPTIFNWEPNEADFRDFYGGVSADQAAVVALMKGDEADYELGVQVTKAIYAPVNRIHRVTLEQMAILEPALVETLAQSCIEVVHEGYEHVVSLGVPQEAARDFVLGHLRIQIAVLFKEVNGSFSDAAYKISKHARPIIFKDDWKKIFEMEDIREQVRNITDN